MFRKNIFKKFFFYGLVSTHLTPKLQYFVWLHLIRGTKKQFKFILYMNRTKEQLDQYISFFSKILGRKQNVLIRILICPFMDFIKILEKQKTENEIWFNKNSLFLLPFVNKNHCA